MVQVIIGLFGLVFGSFLNVCILRVPRRESIVSPGSHCPACGHAIRWHDNIPVLSYVILRGRCRDCGRPISLLYPLVEILTAAAFLLEFAHYGLTPEFFKGVIFAMLMIVLIFTDLRERRIPHKITLLGLALGIALSLMISVDSRPIGWILSRWEIYPPPVLLSLMGALAGALVGGGLFYAVGEAYYRISPYLQKDRRREEGLGFGDVMLMLTVGTFLGPLLTLMTILLGSLLGTAIAVPLTLIGSKSRKYLWPYGSFLGIAAIYASIGGETLLRAYLQWGGFR